MSSQAALTIQEHPWEARTLPRRPTRLVAVAPASPRRRPRPMLGRALRQVARALQQAGPAVSSALECLAFLWLLAGLLGGIWALSQVLQA